MQFSIGDTEMERSFGSGILCQGVNEAKVLSTQRAFVQMMNFCFYEGDRPSNVYARQTEHSPPGCALPGFHRDIIMQWRCPFCKGDPGLLIQVDTVSGWVCCRLSYPFAWAPWSAKAPFVRQLGVVSVELLPLYQEQRKGDLIGPIL